MLTDGDSYNRLPDNNFGRCYRSSTYDMYDFLVLLWEVLIWIIYMNASGGAIYLLGKRVALVMQEGIIHGKISGFRGNQRIQPGCRKNSKPRIK